MPEKSKRRKNNKNKRKNKNTNRPDNSDTHVTEMGSQPSKETNPVIETLKSDPDLTKSQDTSNDVSNLGSENSATNTENQDLNNNTNNAQASDDQLDLNCTDQDISNADLSSVLSSLHTHDSLNYLVEIPQQQEKNKSKLLGKAKSKSLDNDDEPKIVEITEDTHIEEPASLPVIDYNNVVTYDTDSDVEWEKTGELKQPSVQLSREVAKEILSLTLPLDVAQCEHTKALTPEEEKSLRNYLKTLQLSTSPETINSLEIKTEIEETVNQEVKHRLRKKASADDFFVQRLGPSRVLDVIDEEVSGESSAASRRQSYLSDKKSDVEDLEDEVFEKRVVTNDKFNAKCPRFLNNRPLGRLIQQQCLLVGAKLKEPEITEARGDWTVQTVEKLSGAEVIYLTDSSSSTSSLHEIGDDTDDGIETDVSIRMVTPTIEVTDTENLLKKTFISTNENASQNEPSIERIIKIETEDNYKTSSEEPSHEIIINSTDDIKTNLFVKDLEESDIAKLAAKEKLNDLSMEKTTDNEKPNEYDLEIKVIKCELNDAINNLIREVSSDSESGSGNIKEVNDNKIDSFTRQDSSSSVCSSQSTAKYNPTFSSLNDVSNIQHDEMTDHVALDPDNKDNTSISHVKQVINSITEANLDSKDRVIETNKQPCSLKDVCIRKISGFPYGDKILEELASVSERLQQISIQRTSEVIKSSERKEYTDKMPHFPLPDLSSIDKVSLPLPSKLSEPPPIKPRNSSLKKSQEEDYWTGEPTNTESVYICLSPSQKMLMEKTNTVLTKDEASNLMTAHKKFIDRRGSHEVAVDSQSKMEESPISPVVPFKSQTGSRLLALICDPAITKNVNSLQNRTSCNKNHAQNNIDNFNTFQDFQTPLKPIPLPKPRKFSSSRYESDDSSEFADLRSITKEKKFFHFSTGNLNKEIENDITSIQNLHRFQTNLHNNSDSNAPRRPSLPKDLCDQQMEYIRQKEKEIDAEIQRLEEMRNKFSVASQRQGPKAPLIKEENFTNEWVKDANNFKSHQKREKIIRTREVGDEYVNNNIKSSIYNSQEEIQREKMYSEYVTEMAEREERKQHKVIKITQPSTVNKTISKSMSALDFLDSKVNNRIEKEFISRARERWEKLGIRDPETEDERDYDKNMYKEPKVIEHRIKVIEDGKEKDVQRLPSHLQEFVRFTAKEKGEKSSSAVWRPGAPTPPPAPSAARSPGGPPPPPPPPIWAPGSAGPSPQASRKTFRPVHFEETPPPRRKFGSADQNGCTSGSESESRLKTSHSAPVTGLSTLGSPLPSSRLPRAPNPTVTLLQKAREGQIPRGTSQSEKDSARLPRDRPSPPRGDPVHALRKEYASESEAERSDYERGGIRKMADAQRKVEGIGPTTKEGIPITLRSEVKDPSRWYKKMYDTIHKNKYDDDYVTIRYKNRRGQPERVSSNKSQYAYFDPRSGYLSEPEGGLSRLGASTWSDAYDSDIATGPRRRTASVQEDRRSDITSSYMSNNKYSTLASARASQEMYKNQPGRIEDYVPGRSSVMDQEAKQQNITSTTSLPQASPKEKKDITSAILSKSNMAKALKESGYESDSTLIFRRREETDGPLSPAERRAAYRDLQAGGEPPLRGFRSPAPPRQESPRRYVESDVNIHYRCPVRHDPLPLVPERELARQQADHMKRLYREQRRNKYLQELQDMQNRRHQDNFTPSQKNILPLNRYDEPEKGIAKALYTFNGQTARELSFRKGEIIHVRRQIDANWYEGEVHGKVGLFPYNYVEILKGDTVQTPKKPTTIEGRARAKFDFIAQTNLELPLKKGEVVVLTRRIDQNWWEGKNGTKTGIFPDSYITVLQEPSQSKPDQKPILNTDKPVASPAAHGLLNGTDKRSMGSHSYTPQPNSPALANAPPATQPLPGYVAKPAQSSLTPSDRGYGPPTGPGVDLNNAEPLYVDTNAEAVPYRAMYKYRPQNPDELELQEGDTVYVLEKCDDGWYVGSSQRTGRFGTFPGNYVERI